jgi:O-antigen/teichoic acid export membrane protein
LERAPALSYRDLGNRSQKGARAIQDLLQRHRVFVLDIATLITGKAAGFVFTLAATPIISRLFTPHDYGIGAIFATLVLIAVTVASLTWERAVIVAASKTEAVLLSRLGWYTLLSISMLAWLIALAVWACGGSLPYADQLGAWIWLLPIGVIGLGAGQLADAWLTRSRQFKPIARSEVALAVVTTGSRILCGAFTGSSVWALILSQLVGRGAKIVVALRAIPRRISVLTVVGSAKRLRVVAARHRDFPLYGAPNLFLRNFSQELPTVMFGLMYSPAVVGYYAMASRLGRLPLNLASVALQRVVLQKFAELHNGNRRLAPAFAKVTIGLAAVALPPFLALWIWGEWLCTFVLGARWTVAGKYVVIVVPWLYALWVSNPAAAVMTVLRRQSMLFKAQIVLAAARLTVFGVALVTTAAAESTLHAFVIVSAVAAVSSCIMTYLIARRSDRQRNVAAPG